MPTKDFRHVRKASVVKTPDGGRIKLGSYRPDKKNSQDKVFQSSQFSTTTLPAKVDLRPYMTPVENQGDSNSCTANAMAGAYEYLGKRLNNQESHVSRLFIYYNARDLDGDPSKDEGTYLRSCIQVLKKYGTCSEQTWPFDLHRIYTSPEEIAYNEATNFLVEDAYRVDVDLDKMRSCLAEGYPFTFGLELFASFQNAGSHGLIPMPDPDKEQHDGGHAMLCVGYSDADRVFIVRNSWGDDWGDRGYCYIPYDYMTNPDLNGDLWSIRRVTDAHVDLSQNIQGTEDSLFDFDPTIAAIAAAIQLPGASAHVPAYTNGYAVEYESQSVYLEGQGYVSLEEIDDLESLYYLEYEDEYEEYTTMEYSETSENSTLEVSEESYQEEEFSEEESEETEETEDSYEEDSEEEDSEEEDSEEEDSEETEDSYEEDSEEEETEDSYEEDSEEEDSEETEDSYEEDSEEESDDSEEEE